MRVAVTEFTEPDTLQPGLCLGAGRTFGNATVLQTHHDVADSTAPRHQRFTLKHVACPPIDAVQRLAKHPHRAGRRLKQTRADIKQCGLTATRRADH
jgi:hypothetical protein